MNNVNGDRDCLKTDQYVSVVDIFLNLPSGFAFKASSQITIEDMILLGKNGIFETKCDKYRKKVNLNTCTRLP